MKKVLTLALFLVGLFIFVPHVEAAECSAANPNDASCTISGAYSFSATVDGLDGGEIILSTGGTLTVLNGYSVGASKFTISGGTTVINTGASLKIGTGVGDIYMLDSDSDNYPANTTQTFSSGAGYRRKNLMTSVSTTDCYDSNANAKPGQTAYFTAGDRGDTSWDYNCSGAIEKQRLSCNAPVCNTCTVSCPYIDASAEGTACGTTNINAGYVSATINTDAYGACISCTGSGTTLTTMECH